MAFHFLSLGSSLSLVVLLLLFFFVIFNSDQKKRVGGEVTLTLCSSFKVFKTIKKKAKNKVHENNLKKKGKSCMKLG